MATCIETVAVTRRGPLSAVLGSLGLSDAAARVCLREAHRRADELDLLVNAGLYKPGNVAEPALASMIQEDIGANPGHPPRRNHHGTFSFDVLNGGCGVLTALQLVDAFVGDGAARLAMVVAGDSDPAPFVPIGFRFDAAGGAILLTHVPGPFGFSRFEFRTFPEDAGLFDASIRWAPRAGLLGRGRNLLVIRESPSYASRCVERAVDVASSFLTREGIPADSIDVLVANPTPAGFAEGVARGLRIPKARIASVPRELSSVHTAGPIASLEAAITEPRFANAREVLLVTVGAGITVGVALYRPPTRDRRK